MMLRPPLLAVPLSIALLLPGAARGEILVDENAAGASAPYPLVPAPIRRPSVVFVTPHERGAVLSTLDSMGHPSFVLWVSEYALPIGSAVQSGGVAFGATSAADAAARAAFAARRMRHEKPLPPFVVRPRLAPFAAPPGMAFLYPPLAITPSARRSNADNATHAARRAHLMREKR